MRNTTVIVRNTIMIASIALLVGTAGVALAKGDQAKSSQGVY